MFSQSEEVCEGRFESVLHDKKSGVEQEEMSRMEADEKGYSLTLIQDSNQIIISQNSKKEIYIKDEKHKYKYIHKNKIKYLLKPDDKYHDLYMYTKDLLVKYDCTSGKEKANEEEAKGEKKYTIFSKFIKRGQAFLFENAGIIVELDDTEEKKEDERIVSFTLVSDESYSSSIWCYKNKENYLESLFVNEKEDDFEYYECGDPEGHIQIKINKKGFYIIPEYIAVGKERIVNGYPDIDRIEILSENYLFVRGKRIK